MGVGAALSGSFPFFLILSPVVGRDILGYFLSEEPSTSILRRTGLFGSPGKVAEGPLVLTCMESGLNEQAS